MDIAERDILVLGSSGFIGRNVMTYLVRKGYNVTALSSRDLNLLESHAVSDFFHDRGRFSIVIHCCAVGGSRLRADEKEVFYENVRMLDNVLVQREFFDTIVYFSSGAAQYAKDTPYGFSKYIGDKLLAQEEKAFNFRVYGCFGNGEHESRFITSAITQTRKGAPIIVHQDRFFDFIYIEDLCQVVELVVKDPAKVPRRIDLVYKDKLLLSDIAKLVSSEVEILTTGNAPPYVGETYIDDVLSCPNGLSRGIQQFVLETSSTTT